MGSKNVELISRILAMFLVWIMGVFIGSGFPDIAGDILRKIILVIGFKAPFLLMLILLFTINSLKEKNRFEYYIGAPLRNFFLYSAIYFAFAILIAKTSGMFSELDYMRIYFYSASGYVMLLLDGLSKVSFEIFIAESNMCDICGVMILAISIVLSQIYVSASFIFVVYGIFGFS